MRTTGDVIAMASILPTFDVIAVALRFFARRGRPRYGVRSRYRADDYLILFSLMVSLAIGAIMIFGAVKFGYGQSSPGSKVESVFVAENALTIKIKKLSVVFNELQILTLGAAKLSVLFFYRRIFRDTTFNILSGAMVCTVTAIMGVMFFLVLFQCGLHIEWLWLSPANVAGHCLKGRKLALAFSILDMITDILIILMPLYWIWKLHMSRPTKLVISGIFLFGVLAVFASAAKLLVYMLNTRLYPSHYSKPNQLGDYPDIVYYSMLEVGLTIIAACLPTLGPLFSDSFKHRLSGALQRVSTSLPRFRYRISSTDHPAMVSNSESRFVLDDPRLTRMGLETLATAGADRETNEPERQIRVTIAMNRYSSTAE